MKNFIRTIHVSTDSAGQYDYNQKIDMLDLTNCYKAVVYRADLSIDKDSTKNGIINNITEQQTLVVNYEGSYTKSIIIDPDFYTIDRLIADINTVAGRTVISLKTSESNAFHSYIHCPVDFTHAQELKAIFGFENDSAINESENPANITQNKHILQVYSGIVESGMPSSLFNLQIKDPTIDFHQSFFINASISCRKYHYIDFMFRDLGNECVRLNASGITLTLFIKAYEPYDRLSEPYTGDTSKFNITTKINQLDDNGTYHKYLEKPLNLKNAKIVNANFLLKGKLYNLPVDQHLTINNNSYTIPKG